MKSTIIHIIACILVLHHHKISKAAYHGIFTHQYIVSVFDKTLILEYKSYFFSTGRVGGSSTKVKQLKIVPLINYTVK